MIMENKEPKKIFNLILEIRRREWSQQLLAFKTDINITRLNRIINGYQEPHAEEKNKICNLLKQKKDFIFAKREKAGIDE